MKKSLFKLLSLFLCVFIIIQIFFLNGNGAMYYSANGDLIKIVNALGKAYPKSPDTLRIMSYNLLADTPGFEGSPAYLRASGVCSILNTLKPDVAGLQETSRNWFYALNQGTQYAFISPVKTNIFGTMTTIVYNKETVSLHQWGEYVFPKTYSTKLRCAVWGLFKEKRTSQSFVVINTHLSLKEKWIDSPLEQATDILLLADELKKLYNCPVFFVGDFNSDKRLSGNVTSPCVYETLCTFFTDTRDMAKEKSCGENRSFSSYRADHIFVTGEADILRYVILSQAPFADLSNHYPIFIDISI